MPRGKRKYTSKKVSKATKQYVKKTIARKRENKFYESVAVNGEATSTITINQLFAPSQGDTVENRNGDDVDLTKIHLTIRQRPDSTHSTQSIYRMLLFQWKADSASDAPTSTADLISNTATNVGTALSLPLSMVQTSSNIHVLKDVKITMPVYSASDQSTKGIIKHYTIYGKNLLKKVSFNPAVTSGKNLIYIALFDTNAIGSGVRYDYVCTTHYKD